LTFGGAAVTAPTTKIRGGYVVRDANGQALAHIYSRDSQAAAGQGPDEERGAAHRRRRRTAAGAAPKGRAPDVKMMKEVKKEPYETLRLRTPIASVRSRGLGYMCDVHRRTDQSRAQAEQCRQPASLTPRDDDKTFWLRLAEDWVRLAEVVALRLRA
jgi:hypothetical protein